MFCQSQHLLTSPIGDNHHHSTACLSIWNRLKGITNERIDSLCHNRRINHFQLYINSKLSDHYWCSFVLVVRISLRPSRRPSFHIFPWESIEKARDRLSDQGRDLGTQVVQGYGSCYHPLAFFALAVLRSKRFTLEKFENLQQRRVCRLLNWEAGGVGKHVKDQRKILIVTKITKIFLIFNIFGGILFLVSLILIQFWLLE